MLLRISGFYRIFQEFMEMQKQSEEGVTFKNYKLIILGSV